MTEIINNSEIERRKKISVGLRKSWQEGKRIYINHRLGKKHSLETRKKLSELHLKRGTGKNLKGIPKSEVHKNKLRLANLGKKQSLETRRKIAESHRGEKNYLWNGGKDFKSNIRGCYLYRQWRSDVFTRDNFTCQHCSIRGAYLEADHYPKLFSEILREYEIKTLDEALNCEELWNINNGRTLCRKCHDKTKIWWKKRK